MKKDWEERSIQDIANIVNGYAFKSKDFKSTNAIKSIKITNVGVNEFIEETDNYLPEKFKNSLKEVQVREGNIVIALTRTIISAGLKVAVVPESYDGALLNQRVAALVPNEKVINQRYLYYFLTTNGVAKYVLAHVNTLMQPNLSINDLKKLLVPCSPLPQQKRIVAILDEAFAVIAKAKANAERNLQNAKELFESYLQSALANNGVGWEEKELMEVCEQITDGSHFSPKSSSEGEYPYITVRNIDNDIIDFKNCKFIAISNYQSLLKNGCKPHSGDLLFSKDGTVGKVSLVDFEKEFVVLSSLAIIRPNRKIIDSTFLKYILKNPAFLQKAIGMKTGVAIRRIILKNLKLIQISFPKSLSEQQSIVKKLDTLSSETKKLEVIYQKKINNLEELKKSILQKAFSGELKTAIKEIA
jgi:type I restriction enzyme, S subunit